MTCRPPTRFVTALVLSCICSMQSACSAIRSPFDNYRDDLHAALLAVSDVDPRGGQGRLSNAGLDQAFRTVVKRCSNVLNLLEARSDGRRTRTLLIAVVGTVAGSVAAPAVIATDGSMALSAGLSGLAGASNAAQDLFGDQGYTRSELILAREHMISSINGYVAQWLRLEGAGEGTGEQGQAKLNAKLGIVQGLIVTCSMYQLGEQKLSEDAAAIVDEALETTGEEPTDSDDEG
ncbi:MAG: hypothetical protein CMQ43_14230 [Gammaproteobacteria bacterium]|nr:hypothetical protein [Gammaproteobacteria bacterium]|tara:strand:+ start:3972 stop:4673 length:702 start_codon:yes stop_codon:yes gene_type:complete